MTLWLNPLIWRYWAPSVFWAIVIMVLSGDVGAVPNSHSIFKWVVSWIVTLPPQTLNQLHFKFRKAMHVICYGVLAILWFRALMASRPRRMGANLILALMLCLGVALIDEGHQHLLTSRTGSLGDVGLDMGGAVGFALVTAYCWRRRNPAAVLRPYP
ncbi:MAG: VanZ family protein [Desulfobaccales bacterium]